MACSKGSVTCFLRCLQPCMCSLSPPFMLKKRRGWGANSHQVPGPHLMGHSKQQKVKGCEESLLRRKPSLCLQGVWTPAVGEGRELLFSSQRKTWLEVSTLAQSGATLLSLCLGSSRKDTWTPHGFQLQQLPSWEKQLLLPFHLFHIQQGG